MRIVFGTYSWKQKSLKPEEVGITPEENVEEVQIRQSIFHLFWIPIFSIGKRFVFLREGSKYVLPKPLELKARQLGVPKTPWYAFFAPIAAIVILSFLWVRDEIRSHRRAVETEEWYTQKIAENDSLMNHLDQHSYLFLKGIETYTYQWIKVDSITSDVVYYNIVPTKSYSSNDVQNPLNSFEINGKGRTFVVSRNELRKGIPANYEAFQNKKVVGVKLKGTERDDLYFIENIVQTDQPIFDKARILGSSGPEVSSNTLRITWRNKGLHVNLIDIKDNTGVATDFPKLPVRMNRIEKAFRDEVEINFRSIGIASKIDFIFTFQSDDGRKWKYKLKGDHSHDAKLSPLF